MRRANNAYTTGTGRIHDNAEGHSKDQTVKSHACSSMFDDRDQNLLVLR
jgi:hypothetical protein